MVDNHPQYYLFSNLMMLLAICIPVTRYFKTLLPIIHFKKISRKVEIVLKIQILCGLISALGAIGFGFVSLSVNRNLHHFCAIMFFCSSFLLLIFTEVSDQLLGKRISKDMIVFAVVVFLLGLVFYIARFFTYTNLLNSISNCCEHIAVAISSIYCISVGFKLPKQKIKISLQKSEKIKDKNAEKIEQSSERNDNQVEKVEQSSEKENTIRIYLYLFRIFTQRNFEGFCKAVFKLMKHQKLINFPKNNLRSLKLILQKIKSMTIS